jgi:hypothetical protein
VYCAAVMASHAYHPSELVNSVHSKGRCGSSRNRGIEEETAFLKECDSRGFGVGVIIVRVLERIVVGEASMSLYGLNSIPIIRLDRSA